MLSNVATKKFKRTIEDFRCGECGATVRGNGFTNHCPWCLWSKHVDNNPGDREAFCDGMMTPIQIEKEGEEYIITHKCKRCGHEKRNKTAPEDDFEVVVRIAKKQAEA